MTLSTDQVRALVSCVLPDRLTSRLQQSERPSEGREAFCADREKMILVRRTGDSWHEIDLSCFDEKLPQTIPETASEQEA